MKRIPFERPTDHYDERIFKIDEQLCALLKQRKEISNNNPGFPFTEFIINWARTFDLYEDFLKSIFGTLMIEEHFRTLVEPTGFLRHLPVLKSIEKNEYFYSVTSILQYTNASVVKLSIDWDSTIDSLESKPQQSLFKLYLGEHYDCRMAGGCGSTGHYSYNYVVSPALPDDISGLSLVFRGDTRPFGNSKGLEIVMHLE